jgi:hypothetical protein
LTQAEQRGESETEGHKSREHEFKPGAP